MGLNRRVFFISVFLFAGVLTACGGGGGGGGSVIPAGTPTPHAGPTTIPVGPSPDVINLSGDGYNLEFTVPAVVTGTIATMNASLQTALPSGTVAPQSSKRRSVAPRKLVAPNIGANVKGLVYLVVSTSATVGFASAPSFQFTMPSGTTIPSGQSSYLLFWDPNAPGSTGWVALLGPGAVSGQVVTFPGVQTGVNLEASTQYVYALAVTTQPVPTASPAPTPTPTPVPAPTSTPLSTYCSTMNYSTPSPADIPVDITDDSGIGAVLVVYIHNGATWLAANGFTSSSPNPLPAGCFSTTKGSKGTVALAIPQGVAAGRIYLALATPNPNGTIPNPFGDVNATTSGPAVGYQAAPFPWGTLEYGSIVANTPVIDTTQVDSMGLPIELSLSSSYTATPMPDDTPGPCVANSVTPGTGPYGVTSCKFAQVFTTMQADANYKPLVYTANFPVNGVSTPIDMQVVSPQHASSTSFDSSLLSSYVQSALTAYQSNPQIFTNNVSGTAVAGWKQTYYCASSDGSNFFFTNDGSTPATPCPARGAAPNTFEMPAALFTQATVPVPDLKTDKINNQCVPNELFGQPFGLAYVDGTLNDPQLPNNELFASNDAFAMWKALVADLNYGMALQTGMHPIGQVSPPPITPSQLFQDSSYNHYDKVLHDNFNGGYAYGIAYDDLYTLESGTELSSSGGSILIRVNPIPVASSVMPASAPSPAPTPTSCPTVNAGVGSY